MANIDANSVLSLRNKVKNELLRRNGHGPVSGYGSTDYDFTLNPNSNIGVVEFKKTMEPILAIRDVGAGSNKMPDSSAAIIDIDAANKLVDILTTESYTGAISSCRSSCTGLCLGSCTGTCNGCSGTCNTGCQGCNGCSACDTGCAVQ